MAAPVAASTSGRCPPYGRIALWFGLVLAAVVWLLPILFVAFTALKSRRELLTGSPFLPPTAPTWGNFAAAWERGRLGAYGWNSLLIAVVKVPLGLAISSLAAFALTRLRFSLRRPLLLFLVVGALVPVQITLGPLFHLLLRAGLLNTYAGVLLPYVAF